MPDDEQDQHVAWCKYVPDERRGTRIKLCDSDAPGAFRVFRSAPAEKARALLIHEQSQRSMERDALQAEVQRLTAYVDAFRREERRADDAARDRDDARAEAQRLTAEREAVKAELDLAVKKVITCGVAASHSDANLTRTGAYAGKWDSQQAEAVRALRAERDALLEKLNKPVVLSEWQLLVAERDALRRDAERLMFACEFDGYSTVSKDRYDFAMDCAEEAGRDEPSDEDELNGLRRLIDAAMAAQPGGEPR